VERKTWRRGFIDAGYKPPEQDDSDTAYGLELSNNSGCRQEFREGCPGPRRAEVTGDGLRFPADGYLNCLMILASLEVGRLPPWGFLRLKSIRTAAPL